MKAEDTRKISIESANDQINEIERQITDAAKEGSLSIIFDVDDDPPLEATKQYLIDEGYKVELVETTGMSYYKISW